MCAVADLIREQKRERLHQGILNCEAYELVPDIADLLEALREARSTGRQTRSSLPSPF